MAKPDDKAQPMRKMNVLTNCAIMVTISMQAKIHYTTGYDTMPTGISNSWVELECPRGSIVDA
jgi:hypothetical protein